jgi:hypothetical protein
MAETYTGENPQFSTPTYSSTLSGEYKRTAGYFTSQGRALFIGSSCHKKYDHGLWSREYTGKAKYISALKPCKDRANTYFFDTFPDKEPHLFILKSDRARIVHLTGGQN